MIVCVTSDRAAMERVRAAHHATAIAEGFRSEGRSVLLLMDSVTRFARALREIGLAAGEPAVRPGFPPSIFAELPRDQARFRQAVAMQQLEAAREEERSHQQAEAEHRRAAIIARARHAGVEERAAALSRRVARRREEQAVADMEDRSRRS